MKYTDFIFSLLGFFSDSRPGRTGFGQECAFYGSECYGAQFAGYFP
jgi:hypothetical protein